MKRFFVFVPAILLVLFLLNSFVPKEKEPGKKISEAAKSFTGVNIVLKSIDSGQTWRDITTDKEKNWKQVQKGLGMNMVESDGVLIATGGKGIMRSTDNGKHWQWVISEGGVGIAVERIKGGFAAITYNTATKSRRIRISLDKGKTWQAIDKGLRPASSISSIKQMGSYLICGHPDGIYRSADMGKTWDRVLCGVATNEFEFVTMWNNPPSEPKNVYKIYVFGNVLYAVAVSAGC